MSTAIFRLKALTGIASISFIIVSCSPLQPILTDPFYTSFLEKTRLIMTEEEIELYLHLPDRDSKSDFIGDFWKIRDPDPSTVENENLAEFNRRIQFANEWFGLLGRARPKPAPPSMHRNRGWYTDRGIVYIVMGPPDSVSTPETLNARDRVNPEDGYHLAIATIWYYERFQAPVLFSYTPETGIPGAEERDREYQRFVRTFPTISAHADLMERAKLEWVSRDQPKGLGAPLRFKAAYKERGLDINIPIKAVRFLENEDRSLTAAFTVDIRVYWNDRKVDTLSARKTFSFQEKEVEALDQLEIRVPFDPPGKGRYLFDVIVKLDDPSLFSRRRQYVRAKL